MFEAGERPEETVSSPMPKTQRPAATETAEADLIETYLPAQLSDDELQALVASVIADVGATSVRDMGAVMKEAGARAGASADGKKLSTLVRAALS